MALAQKKNPLRQEFQLGGPTSPINPLKNIKSNKNKTARVQCTPSITQHNVFGTFVCTNSCPVETAVVIVLWFPGENCRYSYSFE
jgi:hypothetical protein